MKRIKDYGDAIKDPHTRSESRKPVVTDSNKPMEDDCYKCIYKGNVPGNCHISCRNPDADMIGEPYGVRAGWFDYPFLFDPIWKRKECSNFSEKKEN
jgi:hypothetical protein